MPLAPLSAHPHLWYSQAISVASYDSTSPPTYSLWVTSSKKKKKKKEGGGGGVKVNGHISPTLCPSGHVCLSSSSQTFTASCPLHKVLIRQVSLAPMCGCRTNSEQPLKQEMIATVQRQPVTKYSYQWKSTGFEKQHFCCCCCCSPELHGYSQCPIVTVKYQKLLLPVSIYACLVIVVQPFVDQLHVKCSLVMDAAIIHSCWSLLYSAILHSQADSLCSHMILHEWLAFQTTTKVVHLQRWHGWCHMKLLHLACSVYSIQPCTVSLHAKPHT